MQESSTWIRIASDENGMALRLPVIGASSAHETDYDRYIVSEIYLVFALWNCSRKWDWHESNSVWLKPSYMSVCMTHRRDELTNTANTLDVASRWVDNKIQIHYNERWTATWRYSSPIANATSWQVFCAQELTSTVEFGVEVNCWPSARYKRLFLVSFSIYLSLFLSLC